MIKFFGLKNTLINRIYNKFNSFHLIFFFKSKELENIDEINKESFLIIFFLKFH